MGRGWLGEEQSLTGIGVSRDDRGVPVIFAGVRLVNGVLVGMACCIRPFPWGKYSHHGPFQATRFTNWLAGCLKTEQSALAG